MDYRPDGAQSFLNRYKDKLGKQLDNGNYHEKKFSENVDEKRSSIKQPLTLQRLPLVLTIIPLTLLTTHVLGGTIVSVVKLYT